MEEPTVAGPIRHQASTTTARQASVAAPISRPTDAQVPESSGRQALGDMQDPEAMDLDDGLMPAPAPPATLVVNDVLIKHELLIVEPFGVLLCLHESCRRGLLAPHTSTHLQEHGTAVDVAYEVQATVDTLSLTQTKEDIPFPMQAIPMIPVIK